MKALVLGCGSIGLRHIGHLRRLGFADADIAVADPSPAARERAKTQQGITVEQDPERALDRRPDVVLVCTPAATHVPLTLKALDAGAHVFVEKPLSTSLEGLDALTAKVRATGRVVQVGYQLRYHPAMRETKAVLDAGRLGPVLAARAEFGLYLPKWWPGRDYRRSYMVNPEEGGGLLLDVSHEIDLMMWFLGPVQEVVGYSAKHSALEIHGVDLITVLLKMAGGALVYLHIDCLQPTYTRGYRLIGAGTALHWDCLRGRADRSVGRLQIYEASRDRFERVRVPGRARDAFVEELRDFISAVTHRRPSLVGVADGIEVLRVVQAIHEAVQTGRSVQVSGRTAEARVC